MVYFRNQTLNLFNQTVLFGQQLRAGHEAGEEKSLPDHRVGAGCRAARDPDSDGDYLR